MAAGVFLLPLAWAPWLANPFAAPKLWLLVFLGSAGAVITVRYSEEKRAAGWAWLAWPAAAAVSALAGRFVSFEALALALAPAPLFLAARRMPFADLEAALLASSAVESLLAVLQYGGLDPLRVLPPWQPETFASPRMRVYGTLGNPDFVAAWLCATLPLWAAARGRRRPALYYAGAALQLMAIFATGSRLFLFALPVAAVTLAACGVRPRKSWAAALAAAAALAWLSPARPLGTTVSGRLYLAEAAAAGWKDIPIAGYGPGSFPIVFAQAQMDWLRQHPADPARQFAGLADHAHNDYLEMLVEYGFLGLGALALACGWTAWSAWRAGRRNAGAWAGAACLLAAALVDFPFHRAAEWALFWLFLALLNAQTHMDRIQGESTECTGD
jgi:putative inorganic carbon (HCO3(-)) transporter